ncbi:MAG TPA: carboxypeptidase-like regulatory domain-containing protein, partial [Terriglobales bacterium]|nr:carboxypeptidase-like regulatory domain-containing protein [Terriglobales bacterium]
MNRFLRFTLPFLVLAFNFLFVMVVARPLAAQVDRGGIVGTISDPSGARVPGAEVVVTNLSTNEAVKLTTDASGNYSANLLRIGTYSVAVSKEGFDKIVKPSVDVGVNQVVRVDLGLRVGKASQTVEVTGAPPLLQTETSSLGTIETERRISELPLNGRDFIALAYLGPGANGGMTGS